MEPDRRLLPLFPLPLVQFPGAVTPLHIFEARYRKMLEDVLAGDKNFGIIYWGDSAETSAPEPPLGRAGCAVEVIVAQTLSDGRSNILCAGGRRFRTLEYVEGEPYLQAEVELFDDDETGEDLDLEVAQATELFTRVIAAGRKLKDVRPESEEPPDLPQDAEALSFIICAYLEIETAEKQELLEMTDTAARMRRVVALLEGVAKDYERRALVHEISKKNGHGGSLPENP